MVYTFYKEWGYPQETNRHVIQPPIERRTTSKIIRKQSYYSNQPWGKFPMVIPRDIPLPLVI